MIRPLTNRIAALARRTLATIQDRLVFHREKKIRIEHFGAILQLQIPRVLVFVDRAYARKLGIKTSRLWQEPRDDGEIGSRPLAAPLEAHLQLTNRCDAGCKGCYTAASPSATREWPLERWKSAVDELAGMGVFHLALGGGESADLPWLGDLVHYARQKGLVPNLTTSGLSNLNRVIALAPQFGQINVSIDGLGPDYQAVRGFDGFAQADQALQLLRTRSSHVGINVVVTRQNFHTLDSIFKYAKKRRLNEIELLRFKPAGRGIQTFQHMTCTDAQHRNFLNVILRGAKRYRIRIRVDCSYMPMIAHHNPSPELLASLSVYGCSGGDFLIGAKASGQVTACSFAHPPANGPTADNLSTYWDKSDAFGAFRNWRQAQAPCDHCTYHSLCRGGCRVVSRHILGDETLPDPECPRVIDYHKQSKTIPTPSKALPVLM